VSAATNKHSSIEDGISYAIIARHLLSKYTSMATDMHTATEKPLEAMFSMRFMPRLYSEDKWEKFKWLRSRKSEVRVSSYRPGALSCTVGCHYQATISEGIEDLVLQQ
jgi:hypothetical protein